MITYHIENPHKSLPISSMFLSDFQAENKVCGWQYPSLAISYEHEYGERSFSTYFSKQFCWPHTMLFLCHLSLLFERKKGGTESHCLSSLSQFTSKENTYKRHLYKKHLIIFPIPNPTPEIVGESQKGRASNLSKTKQALVPPKPKELEVTPGMVKGWIP